MIERIVTFAVERRWFVLLMTLIATVIGAVSLSRLPIDAVPDITNNQVQINIRAPALSPELVEKQVAFPIAIDQRHRNIDISRYVLGIKVGGSKNKATTNHIRPLFCLLI